MADRVRITDVSPRDGLQNEPGVIATADKARLVELLCATGVDEVEVSSFVSPKWVPQLGDAADLFGLLKGKKPAGMCFSALAPNDKGATAALEVNEKAGSRLIDKLSVFTAASETFSKRNTNASVAEAIGRFVPIMRAAAGAGLSVRAYLSCVIACPFEGPIPPERVAEVTARLAGLAEHGPLAEIDLGDTIGAGTPETVGRMLDGVLPVIARAGLAPVLHLHDTFGRAADCVREALARGVRSFDGSVAGLGGCPYASTPQRRAPGNIATDLLVRTVHDAGFTTGVDLERIAEAGAFARGIVDRSRREAEAGTATGGDA